MFENLLRVAGLKIRFKKKQTFFAIGQVHVVFLLHVGLTVTET
jgi:hypothetical protein